MKLLKRLPFFCFLLFIASSSIAQDVSGYQLPPKVIADMLLAPLAPAVQVDGKMKYMVQFQRSQYPSVEELGQPEVKIAGLRINPNNFSPTRQNYIKSISIENLNTHTKLSIKGLPTSLSGLNPTWNPTESKIAFFQVEANRVDVYVIDIAASACKKINSLPANLVLGSSLFWQNDNTLWYKVNVNTVAQLTKKPITPKGPTIQENLGKVSPSVTYQDLIKSPYDEYLFGFFATTQLVSNTNGVEIKIGKPAIYSTYSLSPDKKYLLTRTLNAPFSYLVPAYSFASTVSVYDVKGSLVKELALLPSGETTPSGYDNTQNAPRGFDWKDDEAAVITYAMPLDSGLIRKKLPFHDAVFALAAPFNGTAKELFKTVSRYSSTTWGNDRVALVSEQLRSKQTYRMSIYNASTNSLSTLIEGNSTDLYNYPGQPVTVKNSFGQQVVALTEDGQSILMNNITGSSPKGDLPYIAAVNLSTKQSKILWRSEEDHFEYVSDVLDSKTGLILTRSETEKQAPNYFLKNINNPSYQLQLTHFGNPYPALEGVSKEKIKYKRKDGVELTGDLYLPKGYLKEKDGPLPVLMWAYPREFTNAADASQVRGNAHKFTTLSWGSPVFYVTQGYAILDNAEMPIVATAPDKKPNDDFVNQLQLNAEAAIDKLAEMGVGDRKRIAVGGHSYGAFMTANLLAHTNLFKAGIARSGAYNRTLTPFGFQNEERTFWQAPQLYLAMSPFAFADKIKTPILLTHGEMDDNTGTYPINSERLYAALKGHGATVRFVYFPYEAHGYKGKENLLHLLWEQGQWLDKYVK